MTISEKIEILKEKIPQVYEKGKETMWDIVQDYGKRKDYAYVFKYWNSDYIRPKYKVVPTDVGSGNQMFSKCTAKKIEAEYFNLSQKPRGTSYSQGWYYMFSACPNLEEIEDIGMQADYYYMSTFPWCYKLHTIEVLRTDENTFWQGAFDGCYALKNLTIEGTIGKNGFNVKWSTNLTVASLLSILTALSKDSSIASGKSITFSTVHQSVIEADADCLEQYNLAISAGWTIAYA